MGRIYQLTRRRVSPDSGERYYETIRLVTLVVRIDEEEVTMTRGGTGNMLGVGGTRQHLGRKALRGGGRGGRIGGGVDPRAQKRELLRKLREERQGQREEDGGAAQDQASTGGQGSPQSVSRAAR
jgi:hypothetical protein